MDQKTFVTLFIIVTIIAVGGLAFNKLQGQGAAGLALPSAPPSSSDSGLLFNTPTAPGNQVQPVQANQQKGPALLPPSVLQNKKVVIQTKKGTIEFALDPEASMAASNFIYLTNNHFYDGLTFHRVVPGFVIQGGDPKGDGTGGPGYTFADELTGKEKYTTGTVAMANAGPNTNGSQFFIMLQDHPELPPNYTIFGHVISGQDVVDKIAVGDKMDKVSIEPLK